MVKVVIQIKLTKITIKNFLSIGAEQALKLDNLGLVLLTGDNQDTSALESNGSGKSSMLESIVYALYGQTSTGIKGDTLINKEAKKNLKVALEFSIDKDNYRIERYRKDKEFKNKTLLFLNNKEITGKSIKDTNQTIQDIIGIDFNTYLHSYMQGLGNQQSFIDSSDKDKKEILENIADLAIYPKAQEEAKEELKQATQDIRDLQANIEATTYSIKSIKDIYNQAKQQELHNQMLLTSYNEKIKAVSHSLLTKDELEKLENAYLEKSKQLEELSNKLSSVHKIQQQVTLKNNKVNSMQSKLDLEKRDIKNIKRQTVDLNDKLSSLTSGTQDTCYYCGQILDKEHKEKEINRLTKEIQENLTEFNNKVKEYKEHEGILNKAKQDYEQVLKGVPNTEELNSTYQTVNGARDTIDKQLIEQKNLVHKLEDFKTACKQLETTSSINTKEDSKSSLDDKLDALEAKLHAYEDYKKDRESESSVLEKTVEVFSDRGAKSLVMDLILPYLNERTNYYLRKLTDGSIQIMITSTSTAKNGNISDKIDVTMINNNGGDTYEQSSRGERDRCDVAISLAIQDYCRSTAAKLNILCADEIFDGLDNEGCQRVASLLKDMTKEFPTIIVVSHNDSLKEYFDKTITATKKNSFTTLTIN